MDIKKTTVIICEGSVTEPNYFHGLAAIINKKEGRERVIIKPKPSLLKKEEEDAAKAELERAIAAGEIARSTRKRRQLIVVKEEPEAVVTPAGFTAQPVNYVWQAKNELNIHEEAWAVFDLDGHAEQEAAFKLAKEQVSGKKVSIAFSSISFETWILMHFEYCTTAFLKSQCRTQKKLHDCGQQTHAKDCLGEHCTTGYMKTKGYLPKQADVKHTSYETLKDKTFTAINNSLLLRNALGNPVDCYKFIPITTVDKLTFKLLYIDDDYKWIESSELSKYHLSYFRTGASTFKLSVLNDTGARIVIHPSFFQLCNFNNDKIPLVKREILEIGKSIDLDLDLTEFADFDPRFLVLDNQDATFAIIEIQCLV